MQKPQEITRESLNKRHPFCWWGSNLILLNVWWFWGFPSSLVLCLGWYYKWPLSLVFSKRPNFKVSGTAVVKTWISSKCEACIFEETHWCPPEGVQVLAAGDPPFNIGKWRLPFLAASSFNGNWDPSEIVSFGVLFYWTMTMGERLIMDPLHKKTM